MIPTCLCILSRARRARPWALALTAAGLTACGGGGGGSDSTPAPSTYSVGVTISSDLAAGETFRFALGTQAVSVTAKATLVNFAQALATGAAYTVSQTEGPRTCTLSANRTGTVASASISVTADCGTPPAAVTLTGELHAPTGAQVVLQANAGNDLPVTVTSASNSLYDLKAFAFTPTFLSGSAFQVSVKTAPAGQTCSVYRGASGTLPVSATAVAVGCEFDWDHVSRSADTATTLSAVRATYFETFEPAIGGAAAALGSTTQGYGEGRFVVFTSSAVGLAGPGIGNGRRQVYWRDRMTGETILVSAAADGTPGNGDSGAPAISADGLSVAFDSAASNLVANDTNAARDVFFWQATNRAVGATRVSVGPGGVQANSESSEPSLSGDAKVLAYTSGASNLAPGVSGISTLNVYRRDLAAASNTLVTASAADGSGVGGARPMLSEDGNRLAFYSFSAALVAGDTNGLWDVFVYDHAAGTRQRVSLTSSGGERNQGSESASRVVAPAISGNGRYVAYATTATNVVAGDTNGLQDVFVVDTSTGTVQRVSGNVGGLQGDGDSPVGQGERVSLSYDGTWVAFTTAATNLGAPQGGVLLKNRVTGEMRVLSANLAFGYALTPPVLSREAAYAVFGAATPLDPRYASSGVYARFTGIGKAWWWY